MREAGISWDIGRELVVGGSYGIAGVILLGLVTGETAHPESVAPHIWADIRDGLHYLQQQRRVRAAMIQLVILFSAFAALAILVVRLAEVLPNIQAAQFGFLLAAGGVGMACSAVLLGQVGCRFSHYQLSGGRVPGDGNDVGRIGLCDSPSVGRDGIAGWRRLCLQP